MSKRFKTDYPGVFYRNSNRVGGPGMEKVFYIVFKKDGKVIEEKVGRQYKDAMTPAKAARIRADRIEGRRPSSKELRAQRKAEKEEIKWTISNLWDAYKVSKPALKGVVSDENRFKNYIKLSFGDKEPKEITSSEVDNLRVKLLKKRAPATVANILELLRRIINFGIKKNLCGGPGFIIEMPEVNNETTEDLTLAEMEKLLTATSEDPNLQAANLVKLVLFTGMRRGELFRLMWQDIDWERGFIRLRNPKGGEDKSIPMNAAARELLKNHPKTPLRDDPNTYSPYVFPGRGGEKRTDIRKPLQRIKERAGLPDDFRPLHGLRHVYASMLASSGKVDMYTLQRLLTHKSHRMTQRYTHLRDEALKQASDLAGELVNGSAKAEEGKIVNLDH